MKPGMIIILSVILLFLALGCIGWIISLFNSLIQVKNNIGKAWSNIDVLLLQRNEEIPKLIDVVKAYGKYERELLEEIVRLRKKYDTVEETEQKTETENELASTLRQVLGVREGYPDIKADVLYHKLQEHISKLEDMIADRRAFFNATVKIYNVQREQFPQIIFAGMMGYKPHPYLHVPKEERP